jgi:polyisoprenoid-binding protein YceI
MKWQIDPAHTSVEAAAKHMMFTTVRVRFPGATGEIELDPKEPQAAKIVDLKIPVASLDSGDARRDGHLRSADFFDAQTYPELGFRSTGVRRVGEGGQYKVTGDLTIRGETKPVTLDVVVHDIGPDPMRPGQQRAFIDAKTSIDRREWGLVWNMAVPQGVLVSHDIRLEISSQLVSETAASETKAA